MGIRRTSKKPAKGAEQQDPSTTSNEGSQLQSTAQELEKTSHSQANQAAVVYPHSKNDPKSPSQAEIQSMYPPPIDTHIISNTITQEPADMELSLMSPMSGGNQSLLNTDSDQITKSSADHEKPGSSTDLGVSLVRAVVRIRPMNTMELARHNNEKTVQATEDHKAIQIYSPDGKISAIAFDSTFSEQTTQTDFFEESGVRSLIMQAIDGYCATVFAFGQTGSGKTFTITGPEGAVSSESVGLVPRALSFIFTHLTAMLQSQQIISARVQASYLEIYNEHVQDLLNPSSSNLPVRWTAERGFFVENLFIVDCDVLDDCLAVLEEGLRNRTVAAHEMNEHSSRSHSIMTIYFETVIMDSEEGRHVKKHGKLSFVDLAGSEKVKESKTSGDTFNEALSINKSLLALGQCISALADPRKRNGHIPFRDSKLTKLLCDSLGGNGVALMIACISPSYNNLQETIKTLRYAARARRIENRPVVQLDPKEEMVLILKREIQLLRKENNALRHAIEADQRNGFNSFVTKDAMVRTNAKSASASRSATSLGRHTPKTPKDSKSFESPFSTITSPLSPTFGGISHTAPPPHRTVSIAEDTVVRNNPRSSPEKYRTTPFPRSAGSRAPSRNGTHQVPKTPNTPTSARSIKNGSKPTRKPSMTSVRPSVTQQRIASLRRSDAPAGQERIPVSLPYGKRNVQQKNHEPEKTSDVHLPALPAQKKTGPRVGPGRNRQVSRDVSLPPIDTKFSKKSDQNKNQRPARRSPDPTLKTGPMFPGDTPPELRRADIAANAVSNRQKILEDVVALDQEIGRLQNVV